MALGAAPSRIFRLMVGKGLYLSVLGIAIGLLAALILTRVLASMLVEVKPTDPVTFLFVSVLCLHCVLVCFAKFESVYVPRIRSDAPVGGGPPWPTLVAIHGCFNVA